MNHKRFITIIIIFLLFNQAFAGQELWNTTAGRKRIFNALVNIFKENYWDQNYRDWDAWGKQFEDDALKAKTRASFDSVLRRMVAELNDEHSRWLGLVNTADTKIHENPHLLNSKPGLGFSHQLLLKRGLVVERVYPETPAAAAGLHRGDLIVAVNDFDLSSASTNQVINQIEAAIKSGDVRLGVVRTGQEKFIDIKPAAVDFDLVADLPQAEMIDKTTAYIYLPSFSANDIAYKFHKLLAELMEQGANALVLDLRDNPGGGLNQLGLILGAFIDGEWAHAMRHKEVVWSPNYYRANGVGINKLVTSEGVVVSSDSISNPIKFNGSVSVIVSRQNSSAGEISALVLQDFGRAKIIGEKTNGNVEAIQIFDLPDGSAVYVAVANLFGVDGTDFTTGIVPDVIVSDDLDELARGYDAPLSEALKQLKSLPFTPRKYF